MLAAKVSSKLEPMLNGVYNDVKMIGEEVKHLGVILQDCAVRLLPCIRLSKRKKCQDDILSGLCVKSCFTCATWKNAGRPPDSPLYEEKNKSRCAVRKRIRCCADNSERIRAQRRDKMFVHQDARRFQTQRGQKSRCSKLIVGEEIVQDQEHLVAWANHFRMLLLLLLFSLQY